MSTWPNQVRFTETGEAATAGAVNRAPLGLESRTAYLRTRLDQAEAGQSLVAWDVSLDPDLLVGQPAYWNATNGRFEAALASVVVEDGELRPAESARCVGVVYSKEFSDKGAILIAGYAVLDIANATGGDVEAGFYYLSGVTPGGLVLQPQPVTVSVLFADGSGKVFVQTAARDLLATHVHRKFALTCQPAGDTVHPSIGDRHVVTNADSAKPGWLPASYFGASAPPRAVFGYNLDADPALKAAWPPVPASEACLIWNRGEGVGGVQVPDGASGLVLFTARGIWWMSDCYGDVPWPAATVADSGNSSYPSEPSSDSLNDPECPRWDGMRLTLYFASPRFATDATSVLSLEAEDDSPITVVNALSGEPASSGRLLLKFSSDALVESSDNDGSLAIKALSNGKFLAGPVVEGIRSANANLTLTGSRSKTIGGNVYQQGLLVATANFDPPTRDLPFSFVSLEDVKQRPYKDLLYLGFPAGQSSSVLLKLRIPVDGLPDDPKLKIRTQVLGRSAGTLPNLTVSYRILAAAPTAVALPLIDSALGYVSSGSILADYYKQVDSDEISVAAGDVIFLSIARGSADGYSGEVGLLDFVGLLSAGT